MITSKTTNSLRHIVRCLMAAMFKMVRDIVKRLVVAVIVVAVILMIWICWSSIPYQWSRHASVSWKPGGDPMTRTIMVVDADHRPIPNLEIICVHYSGGNRGVTNADGIVVIPVSDAAFLELLVNDVLVMDKGGWWPDGVVIRIRMRRNSGILGKSGQTVINNK
jgi:hypothetical protein